MPKKQNSKADFLGSDISIGGTGLPQIVIFARNLSVMIKAGLTISESLEISADSVSGKLKKIILTILKAVNSGSSLSDGLKQYPKVFPSLFISSVYAGEKSGTLEENLAYVAEQMRKERELSSKIKGAMLYPLVVLGAAFLLGLGIVFFVLPKIIPLFEGLGVNLPATTKALIWFSHFVEKNNIALIVGIVSFVFIGTWFIKQKFSRPATNWLLLHLPIIKPVVRNSNIARFCRTLGTLLKSGLTINEAVVISSQTADNYYYSRALLDISQRMESGTTLASNMSAYQSLFPKLVVRMIYVGEESGKLEDSLLYLASFFEEEVDENTKNLSTAIEPILLIFIGLVVGFLALSIITPIYNITGNIQR